MNQQLTQDFVTELIKLCLRDKGVLDVCLQHIKYQYLPSEQHKDLWKTIRIHTDTLGKAPTLGFLTETYKREIKVLELISEIKKADMPSKEGVFERLEEFIKRTIFLISYKQMGTLYNEKKVEKAFETIQDLAEKIASFSIKQTYHTRIFADHHKRHIGRRVNQETDVYSPTKAPFGIDELDDITFGGLNLGDTFIALAQSGIGKTKLLRHIGVTCARHGLKVLHVQAEGSREECEDGYDATWAGMRVSDIEQANIPLETIQKMKKAASNINAAGGEIYVEAYEQFNTVDLKEIRQLIIDIEKVHGKLHALLIDYFELIDPGNGKTYGTDQERQRREAVANGLKNIALEFQVALFTATQASTVSPDLLNNPEFVQTRYHISEFKGAIKPFSVFVTLNQTTDEYKNGFMRLYVDKLRKYRGGQLIKIYQRYDRERFYDKKKTLNELYSPQAA